MDLCNIALNYFNSVFSSNYVIEGYNPQSCRAYYIEELKFNLLTKYSNTEQYTKFADYQLYINIKDRNIISSKNRKYAEHHNKDELSYYICGGVSNFVYLHMIDDYVHDKDMLINDFLMIPHFIIDGESSIMKIFFDFGRQFNRYVNKLNIYNNIDYIRNNRYDVNLHEGRDIRDVYNECDHITLSIAYFNKYLDNLVRLLRVELGIDFTRQSMPLELLNKLTSNSEIPIDIITREIKDEKSINNEKLKTVMNILYKKGLIVKASDKINIITISDSSINLIPNFDNDFIFDAICRTMVECSKYRLLLSSLNKFKDIPNLQQIYKIIYKKHLNSLVYSTDIRNFEKKFMLDISYILELICNDDMNTIDYQMSVFYFLLEYKIIEMDKTKITEDAKCFTNFRNIYDTDKYSAALERELNYDDVNISKFVSDLNSMSNTRRNHHLMLLKAMNIYFNINSYKHQAINTKIMLDDVPELRKIVGKILSLVQLGNNINYNIFTPTSPNNYITLEPSRMSYVVVFVNNDEKITKRIPKNVAYDMEIENIVLHKSINEHYFFGIYKSVNELIAETYKLIYYSDNEQLKKLLDCNLHNAITFTNHTLLFNTTPPEY